MNAEARLEGPPIDPEIDDASDVEMSIVRVRRVFVLFVSFLLFRSTCLEMVIVACARSTSIGPARSSPLSGPRTFAQGLTVSTRSFGSFARTASSNA